MPMTLAEKNAAVNAALRTMKARERAVQVQDTAVSAARDVATLADQTLTALEADVSASDESKRLATVAKLDADAYVAEAELAQTEARARYNAAVTALADARAIVADA